MMRGHYAYYGISGTIALSAPGGRTALVGTRTSKAQRAIVMVLEPRDQILLPERS